MPAESEIVDIQIRIIPIATPQWMYNYDTITKNFVKFFQGNIDNVRPM